jgi:amidophosphoribosyltransferase
VLLIDDSIVRGNTIGPIIKLLRNAGATEVHIRVASPPLLYPCYMGINIPTTEELIANKLDADELAVAVGKCSTRESASNVGEYVELESSVHGE